jgi:predicted HicB family RNase H-like nuclease
MTSADTLEELWDMIREAKELWLEVALRDGDYIPEPPPIEAEEYSGKFVIRLPRSLHRQMAHRAEQEDTSLNQLVVMLLSEGMGRWAERERSTLARYEAMEVIEPIKPEIFRLFRCAIQQGYYHSQHKEPTLKDFWNTIIVKAIEEEKEYGYA